MCNCLIGGLHNRSYRVSFMERGLVPNSCSRTAGCCTVQTDSRPSRWTVEMPKAIRGGCPRTLVFQFVHHERWSSWTESQKISVRLQSLFGHLLGDKLFRGNSVLIWPASQKIIFCWSYWSSRYYDRHKSIVSLTIPFN